MSTLDPFIQRTHIAMLAGFPVNRYQPQDCEGLAPLVVSEFPTVEIAQQFYDSAEYQPILKRSCSRPFGSPPPIPQ
jgi:hypothetical protein